MAKKILFDINNNIEPFTLILATREHKFLGKIHNADVDNLICKQNFNAVNEISFTVYKEIENYVEPLWDQITNFALVYVKDLNEYYQIVIDKDHSDDLHKEVQGFSLCEAELGQITIYDLDINNANDPNVIGVEQGARTSTIFYDFEDHKYSLLHRVLEKAPHYTIKHVDASLAHEVRMFNINGKTIYDFLTKDCAEQFNCLFLFDSTDRSISVYDLYSVCQNDDCSYYQSEGRHYRGPFNDVCPKCGSTNIYYYGNDTHIFVDRDNLTKEVKLTTDTDSIKNTLRLEAGDALVTATVRNCNPNGSQYINYFSPEMKALMPEELVERLEEYDELYESKRDEYEQITEDLYNVIDEEYYLEHSMMPKRTIPETSAAIEAAKLTTQSLSPVAINNLSPTTTKSSADNAVLGMAKVIVRGGFYKVEIAESTYAPVSCPASLLEEYLQEEARAIELGYLTSNHKFGDYLPEKVIGNIDTDKRIKLEWTQANVNKYRNAIASWSDDPDDYLGSYSTVDPRVITIDAIDIAITPIQIINNEPVYLDKTTVRTYLNYLIGLAGDIWRSNQAVLLNLDKRAGVGKQILFGQNLHGQEEVSRFAGRLGSLKALEDEINSYSGGNTATWTGKFTVTSYADNKDETTSEGVIHRKDSATTDYITVTITDNYEDYLEQKIYKQLAQDTTRKMDAEIYYVTTMIITNPDGTISPTKLEQFKSVLHGNDLPRDDPSYIPGYNLTSLKSFQDAVQSALEIITTMGHSKPNESSNDPDNRFYEEVYIPYYYKSLAIAEEIAVRDNQLKVQNELHTQLDEDRTAIQIALNFEAFLGEELFNTFCAYKRESSYTNSNFTSEGLTTPEIFERVNNYIELATKEMIKAGTPQHTLTANLYNLLVMKEFSVIADEFELGNWIRARIDDQIYRLRLIGYEINFKDMSTLNTTFSNLTITADGFNDVMSVLNQARSMATSYDTVQQQAKKGDGAEQTLYSFRQVGLDSALYKIKNADTEEIVIDNHGLNAANYDDISDSYGDEQVRVTHNMIAFTDDNWKTVRAAVGKLEYVLDGRKYENFGVNADSVVSGIIIGGDIYSGNYSNANNVGTHFDLMNGDFSLAGGKIKYDSMQNKVSLQDVVMQWESISTDDLVVQESNVDGLSDTIDGLETDIGTAQSTASSAQSTANSAQTTANTANTKINNFKTAVEGALNKGTTITSTSVISPMIGGGYLYITGSGGSVEINPELQNYSGASGKIFSIKNASDDEVVWIDTSGNANFTGNITGSTITGSTLSTNNGIEIGDSYIRFKKNVNILEWKDPSDPSYYYTTMLQTTQDTSTGGLTTSLFDGVITYKARTSYPYDYDANYNYHYVVFDSTRYYFYFDFKKQTYFHAPVNVVSNNLTISNGSLNATNVYVSGEMKINNVKVATINDIPSTSNFVKTDSLSDQTLNIDANSLKVNGTSVLTSHQSLINYAKLSGASFTGSISTSSTSGISATNGTVYGVNIETKSSGYSYGGQIRIGTSGSTSNYGRLTYDSSNKCVNFNYNTSSSFSNIACNKLTETGNSSSIKVKENIKNITDEECRKILQLRPVTFDYKWGGKRWQGMIAEEVYKIFPNMVYIPDGYDEDTFVYTSISDFAKVPSLNYETFVPYIIKLCQVQQDEIDILKAQILDIKGEKHG